MVKPPGMDTGRLKWRDLPTEAGLYLVANPLIDPLKPYKASVVEADGKILAGLAAGLWTTVWDGALVRCEDRAVIWFGPIPVRRDD